MPARRILLTGASSLTGSHILDQLLSFDISVRAVVATREEAQALHRQYLHNSQAQLDFATVHPGDLSIPGAFDDALGGYPEPFDTIIHATTAEVSEEADCLSRFINQETETLTNFLRSVKDVATSVRRVVIISSLTPFARWLVDPQVERSPRGSISSTTQRNAEIDSEYVLATSQASDNLVHDALWRWRRDTNAQFDLISLTAPSVYGPSIRPLNNSSDIQEANRRIWNICSNDSVEHITSPPFGIEYYTDVRDLAVAAIQAVLVPEASNRRFVISAGTMPSGSAVGDFLLDRFPEFGSRIQSHPSPPRRPPSGDPPLDFIDARLAATILRLPPYRSTWGTLADVAGQILELHRNKEWRRVVQS